jgi:hypothetical protein
VAQLGREFKASESRGAVAAAAVVGGDKKLSQKCRKGKDVPPKL